MINQTGSISSRCCEKCKMHHICKLEEFIIHNLKTIELPAGLEISCAFYTPSKEASPLFEKMGADIEEMYQLCRF